MKSDFDSTFQSRSRYMARLTNDELIGQFRHCCGVVNFMITAGDDASLDLDVSTAAINQLSAEIGRRGLLDSMAPRWSEWERSFLQECRTAIANRTRDRPWAWRNKLEANKRHWLEARRLAAI